MEILINAGIAAAAFILTEFSAWFNHKYVMHGPLWRLHSDHHVKDHDRWFERNDLFFLFYAIPGFLCVLIGTLNNAWYTWAGAGVAVYGLTYFVVHDVIIHQRLPYFRKTRNIYIAALRRAHKMHHKHTGKEHGESFGMLLIHPRYFREARELQAARPQVK